MPGVAVPGCDDSRLQRCRSRRGEAGQSLPGDLRRQRDGDGQLDPGQRGRLEVSPILQPLSPFVDRSVVISGLNSFPVNLVQDGAIHPRAQTAWLTGALAKKTNYDVEAGTSMDQAAAQQIGQDTVLSSLELAMESAEGLSGQLCLRLLLCLQQHGLLERRQDTAANGG